MKTGRRQLRMVLVPAGLLLVGLVLVTGCKKEPEPAPPAEPGGVASAKSEQTTCPVMGAAINKDIFTEYKGKKVYFCCPPCADKFKAEPEKYIAKLPQFKD